MDSPKRKHERLVIYIYIRYEMRWEMIYKKKISRWGSRSIRWRNDVAPLVLRMHSYSKIKRVDYLSPRVNVIFVN